MKRGLATGLIILIVIVIVSMLSAIVLFSIQKPQQNQAVGTTPKEKLTSTITPARDLTGKWEGSLTFTNNCPNPACRYKGRLVPPSIAMDLQQIGNNVVGNVTLYTNNFEIEELVGLPCPTFSEFQTSTSQIQNGVISSSRFTFTDIGDNSWDFRLTTDLLQGIISNNDPGCLGIQSNDVSLSRVR
mgnify:CR=1 FL=1